MTVPGSWRGVSNHLKGAPEEVQMYFQPVAELIEHYPWEVSLSFLFSKVERAHIMSLYCGVVKLHRVNSKIALTAVDLFENRREEYRLLFNNVFGRKIPSSISNKIEEAQKIRNRILHGKTVADRDFRKAIVAIIDYATEFNELCFESASFRPFGSLQGFKGAGSSLDDSTSRWIVKGIGLPLS